MKVFWILEAPDGTGSVVGHGDKPPELEVRHGARLVPCAELGIIPMATAKLVAILRAMELEATTNAYSSPGNAQSILAGRADGFAIAADLLSQLFAPQYVAMATKWAVEHQELLALERACRAAAADPAHGLTHIRLALLAIEATRE